MPMTHHGDIEVYYETFGSPADPVLVLVNGLGSQCINFDDDWCEQFAAEGYSVVRFDNRDVGLSSKLDGQSYTLSDMAGDAVAVDPLYAASPAALSAQVQRDYTRMFAQMRAKPRLFKLTAGATDRGGFCSINAAESDRRAAAQRFLADFETHRVHGRYFAGALPRLPFLDGAFDLVLCAHLLFTYARQFDLAWHVAACRELARVSAGEVRLHPVCGPDGRRYPELAALRRELLAEGITSELVAVPYEFFAGSSTMLVLNRRAA